MLATFLLAAAASCDHCLRRDWACFASCCRCFAPASYCASVSRSCFVSAAPFAAQVSEQPNCSSEPSQQSQMPSSTNVELSHFDRWPTLRQKKLPLGHAAVPAGRHAVWCGPKPGLACICSTCKACNWKCLAGRMGLHSNSKVVHEGGCRSAVPACTAVHRGAGHGPVMLRVKSEPHLAHLMHPCSRKRRR